MSKIREVLAELNPWWKAKFRVEFKEREIYWRLQKFVRLPQIVALTGLRRVGKTTLMLKMAEDFIGRGLDPKNIIYFSFDESSETGIRELVSSYEDMMEKDLNSGRFLLLLDEIQKLDGWEGQLKAFYDAHKNFKIIISGSESLFIRRKSKETLAGRLFEFRVDPLSFKEFLRFKGIDPRPIGIHERELSRLLSEFTLTMGFPEMVGIKDKEIIKKYVKESIVEKVVYRDMQGLFGIKDMSVVESLLNMIMEEPGQLIELSGLANELKISRQTLSNYLRYLEESFLVMKLYNFSKNRRKMERKLKKYYPAAISADLLFRDDELSKSKVFEWMLVSQMKPEFFWRDPYKNEVDMVIAGKEPVPVEIKYGKIDFRGLLAFMNRFGPDKGYIISPSQEGSKRFDGRSVLIVPAFKFLLKDPTEHSLAE